MTVPRGVLRAFGLSATGAVARALVYRLEVAADVRAAELVSSEG